MRIEPEMMITNPHAWRALTLSAGLLITAGCSTADTMGEIRQLPPSPIRVGIAEFATFPAPSAQAAMEASADKNQMRQLLLNSLTRARTASEVRLLKPSDDQRSFDVILTPSMTRRATFSHKGWANTWWASGGLWLVTWIGGLAINDSAYNVNLQVGYDVQFTYSRSEVNKSYDSDAVDTTFFERNDLISWPTVQSLILPPFLTTDQSDTTREVLTRRAVDSVAHGLAKDLKQRFEEFEAADNCSVKVTTPINGAITTSDSITLQGFIKAQSAIAGVSTELNDMSAVDVTPVEVPGDDFWPFQSSFSHTVRGLKLGPNFIRIMVKSGDRSTRTLIITREQ